MLTIRPLDHLTELQAGEVSTMPIISDVLLRSDVLTI
jgi:hypothetical protein